MIPDSASASRSFGQHCELIHRGAFGVVLPYFVLATLWILLSDRLLAFIFSDPVQITAASSIKGLSFVLVSSALLYVLVRHFTRRVARSAELAFEEASRATQQLAQRRAAESALAESEARYRGVVEDQTEFISRFKPDGTILLVNDAYCRFFGCGREQMIGHRWQSVAVPDDVPLVEAMLNKLSPEKPVTVIENRVRAAAGEMRWCQFVNRAFFDPAGAVAEFQSVGRDISALKQVEEALRQERDFAEDLIRTAQAIVLVLDAEGRIVRANPCFETIAGFPEQELRGKDWFENFLAEDDRQNMRELFRAALAGDAPRGVVNPIRVRGGAERFIEWNNQTLRSRGGEVQGLLCIGQDITERLHAEAALRSAEEKYRRLFETMTQGAFLQSRDGTLLDVNPAALAIFGLTRDEFLSRTSQNAEWEVVREDGTPAPGFEHPSMVALRTGVPVLDATLGVFNARRQCRVWLAINAHPEFLPGAAVPYQVFVTLHDITARWEAEHQLARARIQLQGLATQSLAVQEEERTRLSRELHDEIGQSLTALKLAVDRARRQCEGTSGATALAQAGDIADDLIEATRDIARRLRPSQLDELGLVPAVRWHLDRISSPLQIEFEDGIGDARFPAAIELAAFRIVQESLSNVLRHARARHARVRLLRGSEQLEVSVWDDGVGFDADGLRSTITSDSLGVLGMRERVAALDGHFALRSHSGAGTEVLASFPLPTAQP